MSLKGQKTTSDYIEWNIVLSLILKLERDGDNKFSVLIACGIFTGLRISDLLLLRWSDLIDKEQLTIIEKKTKKTRTITINSELKEILSRNYTILNLTEPDHLIFLNRFEKKSFSVQYVNIRLKEIMTKYKVVGSSTKISSHFMRKSFGRRVFERNNNSEKSLILLSQIFQHSTVSITRTYLALTSEEISEAYTNL